MQNGPVSSMKLTRVMQWRNELAREYGARRVIDPEEYLDSTRGLEGLDPYHMFFDAAEEFGVRVTERGKCANTQAWT